MRSAALILVSVALSSACGGDTPTSPSSSTSTTVTERFDSIIDVRGSAFFPFSVSQSGVATSINLASLSPLDRPGLVNATVEIGWGKTVKDDDGNIVACALEKVTQTTPALTAQLSDTLTPGTDYCANIADVGGLGEAANFSIRITHP